LALELYATGLGIRRIAASLNLARTSVANWLRVAGVMRTKKEAMGIRLGQNHLRWGRLTPERAWLVGLIYGDGGITKTGGKVSLTCENADLDILVKVQNILGIGGKIAQRPGCRRIDICSVKFVAMLKDVYGLDSDKCAHLRWPAMPERFLPHFIRGLLDSDGAWYCRTGRQSEQIVFSYCSISCEFVESLASHVCAYVDLVPRVPRISKTRSNQLIDGRIVNSRAQAILAFSHLDAVALGQWLYANSTDGMRGERKFEFWRQHAMAPVKAQWVLRHERHKQKLRAVQVSL